MAAGSGSRFGAQKQFLELDGQRVIDRAVATAAASSAGVVVVLPAGQGLGYDSCGDTPVLTAVGGATRSASVSNGLAAVPVDAEQILVHDAARPMCPTSVFERVIAALTDGAQAVVPVIDVVDSLRRRQGEAVDRSEFVAVQTPQGFDAAVLREAYVRADGRAASDDATLVEQLGVAVTQVAGDEISSKITRPLDLKVAEIVAQQGADHG